MTFKEYLNSLSGKKVTVIGAGISNTPLINALLGNEIPVSIRDKMTAGQMGEKAETFKQMGAKLILGDNYLDNITEDVIFRTPGLMPGHPSIQAALGRGAQLTSEMEVFFKVCPCRIIGITGSDGKTTTTAIISEMLKNKGKRVYTGGNFGTPLLCMADEMTSEDIAVVELSSFQLMTMKASPSVAVVTNLTPNHLDVHKDIDEYIEAKRNIYRYQQQYDRLVLNYDDEQTRRFSETADFSDVVFFSTKVAVENGVYLDLDTDNAAIIDARWSDYAWASISTPIMQASEIKLPGMHNVANYLAAIAALRGIVSADIIRKTAQSFDGVPHRLEFVRELSGVRYYNDSIASGPTRTIAGMKTFGQKVILIAGGKDKGISFDELGNEINKHVKKLFLTGASAGSIYKAVKQSAMYDNSLEIIMCDDFREAVIKASAVAESGDIVLLSPASTSFDKFTNFEERGNTFKEIVNNLV